MFRYLVIALAFSSQTFSSEVDVKLTLLSESEQKQAYDKRLSYHSSNIKHLKLTMTKCAEDIVCIDRFKNRLREEQLNYDDEKSKLDSTNIWQYGLTSSLIRNKVIKSNDIDLAYACSSGNPKYSKFTFANLDIHTGFYKTQIVSCTRDREYIASCEYDDEDVMNSVYIKLHDTLVRVIGEFNYNQSMSLINEWSNTEESKLGKRLTAIQYLNGNVIYYPLADQCGDSLVMYTYEIIGEHLENPKLGILLDTSSTR